MWQSSPKYERIMIDMGCRSLNKFDIPLHLFSLLNSFSFSI
jgi:hypothetical protein